MEFIFVKTKEFKEMEVQILRTIKYIKQHTIKTIVYSLLIYLYLITLIIILP